jgi:hypothetical protein
MVAKSVPMNDRLSDRRTRVQEASDIPTSWLARVLVVELRAHAPSNGLLQVFVLN